MTAQCVPVTTAGLSPGDEIHPVLVYTGNELLFDPDFVSFHKEIAEVPGA